MEDKRYLFFISSTHDDLIEERHSVMQAIMDESHFPVAMESFPASSMPPINQIKKYIKGCDYFILIIAGKYGSINKGSVISYTEEEYNFALEKGIPVLAFLHSNIDLIPVGKSDKEPSKLKKLNAFRQRVKDGKHTIKYWENSYQLSSLVKSSIINEIKDQPRQGWVRAKPVISLENLTESIKIKRRTGYIIILIGEVEFKMIHVESGTFTMGATDEQKEYAKQKLTEEEKESLKKEEPCHSVTIEDDYWIGETPVTQALWEIIMGYNPSYFSKLNNRIDDTTLPVEQVTWNDCKDFIKKLNELLTLKLKGMEFDFPTEAQWEYAARGGKKSKHFVFAGGDEEVAWYDHTSKGTTHPVASLDKNELGIYDMSGNVWEWCKDPYAEYSGKKSSNGKRVGRGGCWHSEKNCCRVSFRDKANMTHAGNGLGLRLVLNIIKSSD